MSRIALIEPVVAVNVPACCRRSGPVRAVVSRRCTGCSISGSRCERVVHHRRTRARIIKRQRTIHNCPYHVSVTNAGNAEKSSTPLFNARVICTLRSASVTISPTSNAERQSHCSGSACFRARSSKSVTCSTRAKIRRSVTRIPIQSVKAAITSHSHATARTPSRSSLRMSFSHVFPTQLLLLGPSVGVPCIPMEERPTSKPIEPNVVCPSSFAIAVHRTR